MKLAALVVFVAPLVAHAEPGDGFGAPLPGPTAYPAMSSISPYVMSLDLIDVATLPAIDLGNGMSTAQRSALYGGLGFRSYVGGLASGRFGFYSLGGNIAFGLDDPNGSSRMFSIELPSPGMGYRTRTWLVSAQAVPAIQWFTENVGTGATAMAGRDHLYTLAADLQACLQYSFLGVFGKNSAACVYVAPAVYRDGWFQGASLGVRLFAL